MSFARTRGFTLIELSIVLVIIGLIVGGVLVGKDLIEAGMLRQQVAQIERYTTAANTFRLKYGCLPGDCLRASELDLGTYHAAYLANGNGDDIICGGSAGACQMDFGTTPQAAGENVNFWYHMYKAGMVEAALCVGDPNIAPERCVTHPDSYTAGLWTPAAKIDCQADNNTFTRCGIMLLSSPYYNAMVGTHVLPWRHFYYFAISNHDYGTPFKGRDVWAIDRKIDDGLPTTGLVRGEYTHQNSVGVPIDGYCTDNAVSPVTYQDPAATAPFNCTMMIGTNF